MFSTRMPPAKQGTVESPSFLDNGRTKERSPTPDGYFIICALCCFFQIHSIHRELFLEIILPPQVKKETSITSRNDWGKKRGIIHFTFLRDILEPLRSMRRNRKCAFEKGLQLYGESNTRSRVSSGHGGQRCCEAKVEALKSTLILTRAVLWSSLPRTWADQGFTDNQVF